MGHVSRPTGYNDEPLSNINKGYYGHYKLKSN